VSGRDEQLNGLLDGELSPTEAWDIARILRDEPALAARLADLARLQVVMSGIDAALPVPGLPAGAGRRVWQKPGWLAGGTLLALAAAALLAVLPAGELPALAAHHRFLASATETTGPAADLPDLPVAGLRLARVELAGNGIYAGYIGPRGCRLGLWLGHRDGAPAGAPGEWRSETLRQADGRVAWMAASPSMDAKRFAALAEAVRSGPAAGAVLLADASARSACLS
jgi:hypothetical protein